MLEAGWNFYKISGSVRLIVPALRNVLLYPFLGVLLRVTEWEPDAQCAPGPGRDVMSVLAVASGTGPGGRLNRP